MRKIRRLLGAAALAGSLAVGALGLAPPPPASAGTLCVVGCGTYVVTVSPAQEAGVMLNAYVYGADTGAYVSCSQMGYGYNNTAFGDCYWILGIESGYSFPVIQWWAHYGHTTDFHFGSSLDSYTGYSVL